MPTVKERYNWRHTWRGLIDKVLAATADPSRPAPELRYAREAQKWIAPTDNPADTTLCAAFAAMAVAYSYETAMARRRGLAPALVEWAGKVAAVLEEMVQPPAPRLVPDQSPSTYFGGELRRDLYSPHYRLPHADD